MRQTFNVELSGTITRDIIWKDVEAADLVEVNRICARDWPTYRVRSIIISGPDTPTPSIPTSEGDGT